ncbi:MAG: preprotein translocase subunit SecE [bacterium]
MKLFNQLINYVKASRQELKKVSWPSRQETINHSFLVIGISLGLAIFLGTLDYGFTLLVNLVINK